MHPILNLPPQDALRLANERLAGYRTESELHRLATAAQGRRPWFEGLRTRVAAARAAFGTVEVVPTTPPLADYPYRG